MRLIGCLFILFFAFFTSAQTFKQIVARAYHCETDSCFRAKLALAKPLIESDSNQGFYDYIKFFYFVKTFNYDSADYFYPLCQKVDRKYKNWHIYFNTVDARNNTLKERALYNQAVEENKEAIDLAREEGEFYEMALLQTTLSYTYHQMGMHKEGVLHGRISKRYFDTTTIHYDKLVHAINAIAINYDDWGKSDSALYYHYKNLAIGLDNQSNRSKSRTLNNIGNTYLKMGELDSAELYILKSLEQARHVEQTSMLATTFNNLGDIYLRKSQYNKAKEALDSALHYALIDIWYPLEKKRDVYNTLYRYHEAVGDMANAFKYQGLYIQFRDSMHNLDQIEELKASELAIANAKNDAKLAQAEVQVQNRNFWILGVFSMFLLALGVARQFYLKRQKAAQNAQLKLQEERLRISRDLHDNIGAELTYISSVIDQKTFNIKDPEKLKDYELLSNSSRSAMSQLRETIWAIKTKDITTEKFIQKLDELSKKYSEGLSMTLNINYSGENYKLKPAKVIGLFRVCQEAINNAIKYANCSRIVVDANAESNTLYLTIKDDGNGFEVTKAKRGYGLQNMEERIVELGGTYNLQSTLGSGTSIEIEMPI